MQQQNNNPYNQPPQGEPMPPFAPMPPQMGMPGTVYGAQRQRRPNAAAKAIFPQWLTRNALIVYFLALAVVTFMYSAYSLPWYYMLSGVVAVMVFFLYGSTAIKDTSLDKIRKESRFEKRIFLIAFVPRVIWMLLIYEIFIQNYGDAFGFENGDATSYDELGREFSAALKNGNFIQHWQFVSRSLDLADMGYGVYVGLVYLLSGGGETIVGGELVTGTASILALRLLKCVWSSLTVLLLYRLTKRNFGEQIARIAAIFCALWPNFWYYCGTHLKETEMVFLTVLFVEQAEQMLRSRQFTAWKVIPILLIAASLFTVRTVLALVCILALLLTIVMSSSHVINWGKRIIVGGLAIAFIMVLVGNQIQQQASDLISKVQGGEQRGNMEWRSERKDVTGTTQRFAKYAGAAVFAPMIFTLPFPTMVRPFDDQDLQQMLNGGNFIKNIMSFFSIFAVVMLFLSGKWRDHLLPLSMMVGYLIVLTMSSFAHSERFHQPAMPFEFMFTAYGLSIAVTKSKYKRWFMYWCGIMFIAAMAWNWFKLAGRGMA